MTKRTKELFQLEINDKIGNEFEIISDYIDRETEIKIKHKVCGTVTTILPKYLFKRINICDNKECKSFRYKTNIDNFKEEIKKITNNEIICISDTYNGSNTKILFKHTVCNQEFLAKPQDIRRGSKCPFCNKNHKLTHESFEIKFNNKVGAEFKLASKYTGSKKPIEVLHMPCNTKFHYANAGYVLKNGCTCNKCINHPRLLSTEEFQKEVDIISNNEILVASEYINNSTKIKLQCKKCGNFKMIRPNDYKQDHWQCKICHPSMISGSKPENEITLFLKENSILSIKERYIGLLTNYLSNQELDIYLPDKKIAIEFDGLYWHSVNQIANRSKNNIYKPENYHLNKTIECEEQGIHLIHIFEDEWNFKEDIVKSKLLHILGEDHNPSVYARKCYIEEIDSKSKNEFLLENHIQGADKSNIKLGLWYPSNDGDELVAVMTFCNLNSAKGRKSKKGHYELSRFATAHEYRVIGAFGKLWKYFCNNYEFEVIWTFADRRWTYSKDNVYDICGFKLDHISKPNYWYVKNRNREYRYKYRKSELKKLFPSLYSDNKTEKEIMQEAGYRCIYDCGNLVFKFINSSKLSIYTNCNNIDSLTREKSKKFQIELSSINKDIKLIGLYQDDTTGIEVLNTNCGHTYFTTPIALRLRSICPICNNQNAKWTDKRFKDKVSEMTNNSYSILSTYTSLGIKIKIRHNKCGHEWETTPKNFLKRKGYCPKCDIKIRKIRSSKPIDTKLKTSDFKDKVFNLVKDEYTILNGEYMNNRSKFKIRHNKCGHEWETDPHRFLSGRRCPKCSNSIKLTTSDFKDKVFNLVKDEYTILGEYTTTNTKIKIRHNKCNHTYYVIPNEFLRGCRCPECNRILKIQRLIKMNKPFKNKNNL